MLGEAEWALLRRDSAPPTGLTRRPLSHADPGHKQHLCPQAGARGWDRPPPPAPGRCPFNEGVGPQVSGGD